MAIYRFDATGFPVCPTCSLCGLQPISDTGFEQAVAAPSTSARSSIRCQFSGPFNPRPPETTISASAIAIFPVVLSTELTLISKSFSSSVGSNDSAFALELLSLRPYALFARPTIFTWVVISVKLKALLVKAVLLTLNGSVLSGNETTLEASPAFSPADNRGARYLELALELTTITLLEFFSAACCNTSA